VTVNGSGAQTVGSGTVVSQARQVQNFTELAMTTIGDVELTQGSTEGLTIEAEDNILPLLTSTVQNGPPTNVDVQVTGANQAGVTAATGEVLNSLRKVNGLTDLQSNLQARQPQLQIAANPAQHFEVDSVRRDVLLLCNLQRSVDQSLVVGGDRRVIAGDQ